MQRLDSRGPALAATLQCLSQDQRICLSFHSADRWTKHSSRHWRTRQTGGQVPVLIEYIFQGEREQISEQMSQERYSEGREEGEEFKHSDVTECQGGGFFGEVGERSPC